MLTPSQPELPETIETERLILRSPMPGDGRAANEAILETWDELHRSMPWAREPPTVEQTEERIRELRAKRVARTALPMTMWLRDGGTFLGSADLHHLDWSVAKCELGYWVRRAFQGQGYVTEAVRTLTRFAFEVLQTERVEIQCSHRNVRSQKVAERCGFVLEGRLRNQTREPTGELRDTLIYALTRADVAGHDASAQFGIGASINSSPSR
jgi:RimJ/RimL family protein N-acetyltransferase